MAVSESPMFLEFGIGFMMHGEEYYDIDQDGGQVVLGRYFKPGGIGAWRTSTSLAYFGSGDNKVNGDGDRKIKGSTVTLLGNVDYEFPLNFFRIHCGAFAGLMYVDWELDRYEYKGSTAAWGWSLGVACHWDDWHLSFDFKFYSFADELMKDNDAATFFASVGFKF